MRTVLRRDRAIPSWRLKYRSLQLCKHCLWSEWSLIKGITGCIAVVAVLTCQLGPRERGGDELSLQPLFRILHGAFSLLFPMPMHVANCSHPIPSSTRPCVFSHRVVVECRIFMRPSRELAQPISPLHAMAPHSHSHAANSQPVVMMCQRTFAWPPTPMSNHDGIDATISCFLPSFSLALSSNRCWIRPGTGGPVVLISLLHCSCAFQAELNASQRLACTLVKMYSVVQYGSDLPVNHMASRSTQQVPTITKHLHVKNTWTLRKHLSSAGLICHRNLSLGWLFLDVWPLLSRQRERMPVLS